MMEKMVQVKKCCISFRRWKLKTLFSSFAFGTMEFKSAANRSRVVNFSESLLKEAENYSTKFKSKFTRKR